jgi:hypothetical protein
LPEHIKAAIKALRRLRALERKTQMLGGRAMGRLERFKARLR